MVQLLDFTNKNCIFAHKQTNEIAYEWSKENNV